MLGTKYALTDKQVEALQTVVRQGTEEAAKGLSAMVGQELKVFSPGIELVTLASIPHRMASPGEPVVGIYLCSSGDIRSHFTLTFTVEAAKQLCDMLLGQPEESTVELGAMERSALGEVGNITASYFLTSLAKVTGLVIHPSPPAVLVDMCGAVLDIAIADIGQHADDALIMETSLLLDGRQVTGYFLAMPDPRSLTTILESLEK
jgi:chemotaxis protein CheC